MPPNFRAFPLKVTEWRDEPGERERKWLEKVWIKIKSACKFEGSEEISKARLGLRAIALARIYQDFCCSAWDLTSEPFYQCEEWASYFGINRSIIPHLAVIEGFANSIEYEEDEPEWVIENVLDMADSLRPEVFDIICPNYPGDIEVLEELCSINNSSECYHLIGSLSPWFYEKCYPLFPRNEF